MKTKITAILPWAAGASSSGRRSAPLYGTPEWEAYWSLPEVRPDRKTSAETGAAARASLSDRVTGAQVGAPLEDIAELRIVDASGTRRHFRVDGTARIGRSADAEVSLDEAEVSRLHARITRSDNGYVIEDLGSRNGTFVNGVRIQQARLVFGDKVTIGRNTLVEFERYDVAADDLRKRDRLETVGRLGLGIAHDLNNVLGVLVAGTSYLQDLPAHETLGQPDVQQCIADLVLAAGRATDLANSILSFAKGRSAQRTTVDLSTLIREVVRLLRRVIDNRITIEVSADQKVLVHAAWSELHQVVMNLCLNARDAMPKGGVLRIATAPASAFANIPGWTQGAPAAILSISDTGVGMDAETRAKAFDPLFSTKHSAISYGLGLATVNEIVTRHGGRVTVESEVGQGSTFTIYIPRVSEALEDASRQSGTKEHAWPLAFRLQGGPLRVLLVDDEHIVRRSVGRQLKAAGVEVAEASDGAGAIGQCRHGTFDLVVVDLDAPGLEGVPAHVALTSFDPRLRLALATASLDTRKAVQAKTPAVVEILHKPYRVESIIDLAVLCRSGRAAATDESPTRW